MAADKIIKADTKHRELKTFNTISVVALAFIILTAGFMVFQNTQLSNKLSDKEIVATAFAEGIQTMCSEENVRDRYLRMCSIAENYAERSEFLDPDFGQEDGPREIREITCSDNETTIEYTDGSKAVTKAKCNTTDE